MKVYFDHIKGFGKVSDLEVIVNCAYGILEPNESFTDVLKEGWIPWMDKWYNERSTRINLAEYKPSKTTKKLSQKIYVQAGNVISSKEKYEILHEEYCKYHGFKRDINLDNFADCNVIEYWYGKLIGVSFYKQFDKQLVAYQFIWDYANPKLSLGTIAQMIECETAKLLDCEYVYLLGGYEQCCFYKSNFKGFEFWTGVEWSTNVELYKELVQRDEKIKIVNYDF